MSQKTYDGGRAIAVFSILLGALTAGAGVVAAAMAGDDGNWRGVGLALAAGLPAGALLALAGVVALAVFDAAEAVQRGD